MSTTLAVTNYGLRGFSLQGFGTMAADPTVTKTKTVKTVNADDRSVNFNDVAKFGVSILENSTLRTGSVVITTTATLTAAQHIAIVDMASSSFTITLPPLADVDTGHTVYVYVRARTAGTLTIDGNSAETINGSANTTLAAVEGIVRIQKESATNWVTHTV